jgi:hypothetical protein
MFLVHHFYLHLQELQDLTKFFSLLELAHLHKKMCNKILQSFDYYVKMNILAYI